MLKFLKCDTCSDIIFLTEKPKMCLCGACVGAKTGLNLYSYTGRCMTFQIPPEGLKHPEGSKFIGFITGRKDIKLGMKATTNPEQTTVKKPVITVT